jgi:hypothetical protein
MRAMEHAHRETLRRLFQAEEMWRRDGQAPRTFQLLYTGGGAVIDHPGWDQSWGSIPEQTIDELGAAGLLRVDPVAANQKNRTFVLTEQGRLEARAIAEQLAKPTALGGHAPAPTEVLEWLLSVAEDAPGCLDQPALLFDRAIADDLIDDAGREAFARRVLGLAKDGYVRGDFIEVDQANGEQLVAWAHNLELTMKAYETRSPAAAPNLTIYGPVIDSQVALGNISTYNTFVEVLDRAYAEIDALDEIDDETREGAKGLIDRLRGRTAGVVGGVVTGTATALAVQVIARLLGLPAG